MQKLISSIALGTSMGNSMLSGHNLSHLEGIKWYTLRLKSTFYNNFIFTKGYAVKYINQCGPAKDFIAATEYRILFPLTLKDCGGMMKVQPKI